MKNQHPGRKSLSFSPSGRSYPIPTKEEIAGHFHELERLAAWHRCQGRKIVVVQGLGYVGAAVAAVISNATDRSNQPLYFVIGIDRPLRDSYWKVADINAGISPVITLDSDLSLMIGKAVEQKMLCATVSEQVYGLADTIIVDIALNVEDRSEFTPKDIRVDLRSFENAIRTIGRMMAPQALVLIESTVPIGTTERVVKPLLLKERKKRGINEALFLAHSYERVMPGPDYIQSIRRYWRTFAGIDPASADLARAFLSTIIETDYYPLWELENPTSAELSKLLENSYRAVNIAFIHEWTLLAEQLGIDLYTAIESIRVRKGTHDNMRFPGFGVGGYCLTKDSLLAQWSCNKLSGKDAILGMTLEALNINYHMPLHALDLLASLSEGGLQGKRILICGITYIADVADTRNSAAELIVCELISAGSKVSVHDPCAMKWIENPSVPFFRELNAALKDIDGILFTVPHQSYKNIIPEDLLCQLSMPVFIVDAHNVLTDETAQKLNKGGCRILGVGKGHWRRRGYHLYHG